MTNKYIKPSKHKEITKLTLGNNKNVHIVTKMDRFLDNGCCVQLLKEIPMKVQLAGDSLTLNEESIRAIAKFQKIRHRKHEFLCHGYPNCEVFSIVADTERFMILGYESEQDIEKREGTLLGGESYYVNAKRIKEAQENNYLLVKIFDLEIDEINH